MKRLLRLGLVTLLLMGMSAIANATNGQIVISLARYDDLLCAQQFTCTPSGWVPSGDPTWGPEV